MHNRTFLTGLVMLTLMLFLMPGTLAEPSYTYKQNEPATLPIFCFDEDSSICDSSTVFCTLTSKYPDSTAFITNQTFEDNVDHYTYNLTGLNQTGEYPSVATCVGNTTGFSSFSFEVTPTGSVQTNILNNPFLLLFAGLAVVLLIMGIYMRVPAIGFLASIMFIFAGVYTMIFGFNNVTDLYSRSVGGTFIGLGIIFMFISAYEFIWGGD
jgi:hypothetical protein